MIYLHSRAYGGRTKRITDKYNIFTNKASTHPSVTTLSRNSRTSALLLPAMGAAGGAGAGAAAKPGKDGKDESA